MEVEHVLSDLRVELLYRISKPLSTELCIAALDELNHDWCIGDTQLSQQPADSKLNKPFRSFHTGGSDVQYHIIVFGILGDLHKGHTAASQSPC